MLKCHDKIVRNKLKYNGLLKHIETFYATKREREGKAATESIE